MSKRFGLAFADGSLLILEENLSQEDAFKEAREQESGLKPGDQNKTKVVIVEFDVIEMLM